MVREEYGMQGERYGKVSDKPNSRIFPAPERVQRDDLLNALMLHHRQDWLASGKLKSSITTATFPVRLPSTSVRFQIHDILMTLDEKIGKSISSQSNIQ